METSIALVSTYPPTECGLATFASNLRTAIMGRHGIDVGVVRLVDGPEPVPSPEVVAQWVAGDDDSRAAAIDAIDDVDVVLLQHEYGIYPGPDGDEVLTFVEAVRRPVVAVLHTALRHPTAGQRRVLERLMDGAAAVVVQSEAARQRIVAIHGVSPTRIHVIPHGAAANLIGRPRELPHATVLTWGLLGPGKGIEHGIRAIAEVRDHVPPPTYVVAGRTHPKVRAEQDERYRLDLQRLASSLGVADRVRFDDAYRDWPALRALVRSADVVLLPYDSRDQVSSGVLVEAIAAGRPIVATRFPHAEELLADGAGVLVDHGDVGAMASAIEHVLFTPGVAASMGAAARRAARPLLWPAVGASYRRLLRQMVAPRVAA